MDSKGFTLVELLATISILSLIMLIAVPSYNTVVNVIEESQRKNTIDKIEIAAEKYAFDTGITLIFVDELVTEGYIDSDDEEGNLDDPVNNARLNCYIVEMEKSSNYYDATFIDGKNYDLNGTCDLDKLEEVGEGVNIYVSGIPTDTDLNNWVKGSISLSATSTTLNIDCTNNKCEWTSNNGAYLTGTDIVNINSSNGLLETRYVFQYTTYNTESGEIKRYKDSINLKIDNEGPIIYGNEITVSDRFINTTSKTVKISASDGNGSGISGYFLGIDSGQTCYSNSITNQFQTNNTFTVSAKGKYLVCVKDKVGNISSYTGLEIGYIS